ncbi:HigA family addiction module antidote protein [Escherichia albertii]|nr:HigA family addiction module antidote protein [Escherichia albertii]MCB2264634.1 HigA family addiction module antidote protein [Escherichia albertii]MCB2270478.1 HigA family addiction module antidote protein [Escherichia albertii]
MPLLITVTTGVVAMHMFNQPHPGNVLRDYLDGVSVTQAASRLQMSRSRLSRILNGHAPVTADMALRLAALLNTCAELWTGMQSEYDLWQASQKPLSVIRPLHD